jgi:hypothetical protein
MIADSGKRRKNENNKSVIVWVAAAYNTARAA